MGTPEENSATLGQENAQAVDWEKRFKDTQAAYTQSRQEIARLKAELAVKDEPKMQLTAEQQDELEDLKYNNPEEWRKRVNDLEKQADAQFNTKLSEELQKLTELEQRQLTLEAFQLSHPDFHLDDEVIAYDVPKRITKRLETGEINFETFLEEAYQYLTTPKVVGSQAKDLDQPNLNKVGGGTTASASATAADIVVSYRNEVY